MELRYIGTRAEAEKFLVGLGLEGHAVECALKESGGFRHEARILAAAKAADEYVNSIIREKAGELNLTSGEKIAAAVAILWADHVGVGGKGNAGGLTPSTIRHPGLEGLGKGRKNATDGQAWNAAILEAARRRTSSKDAGFFPYTTEDPHNGGVVLKFINFGCHVAGCDGIILPRWQYSLAREGLRRSLGLPRWHRYLPVVEDYPPSAWGALCNKLLKALPQSSNKQ